MKYTICCFNSSILYSFSFLLLYGWITDTVYIWWFSVIQLLIITLGFYLASMHLAKLLKELVNDITKTKSKEG